MIIRSISEVLDGRSLPVIAPDASTRSACETMARDKVDALAVITDGQLLGVLCEQDVVRKCVAAGLHSDTTPVSAIMSRDPVTAQAEDRLADAFKAMVESHIHHLPILKDGAVIGMLSSRDIPTEYRFMLERFQEYRNDAPAA
ncbi:CBS domain-containing protein [Fluviibacterium sp. DFM31]|uniref:CBS domain-containing protein n=1 Tax=Meridianimarinicoccus marinus TaxID=3231483 RepID=A0ABV3L5H4_9RHOB